MGKHTNGPWVADFDETYSVRESDGGRIAICTHLKGLHGMGGRRSGAESAANARLIAAAPELLEALEEMVRWYAKRETASMTVSGGEGLLPIEQQDEEVQQAMRAIAKATSP